MSNKNISNYTLSKLKKIIRKEIEKENRKARLKDYNQRFEKDIESLVKEVIQGFHDALYRKDFVVKSYVKRRKS